MSKTHLLAIITAVGFTAVMASPVAAQDGSASPEIASLFACQDKTDDAARLICFDATVSALQSSDILRDRVTLSSEQVESLERDAFGFDLPSLKQMRGLFGLGGSKAGAASGGDKAESEPLGRVMMSVDRWETFNRGRYRFYLTNGQVWYQIESDSLPRLRKDDSGVLNVEIRKGAFGSFLLKVNGKGRSVRVRRAE